MKDLNDQRVQKSIMIDYLNLMIHLEEWEEVASTADRLHEHKAVLVPSFLAVQAEEWRDREGDRA